MRTLNESYEQKALITAMNQNYGSNLKMEPMNEYQEKNL